MGKLRLPENRSLPKVTQLSELEYESRLSGSWVWSLNHDTLLLLCWVSFPLLDLTEAAEISYGFQQSWSKSHLLSGSHGLCSSVALFITHRALNLDFTPASAKVLFVLSSLVPDALQGIKGVVRVSGVPVQPECRWRKKP